MQSVELRYNRAPRGFWPLVAIALLLGFVGAASPFAVAPSHAASIGSSCPENPDWRGTNLTPCFADDNNEDYCTPWSYPPAWGNQFAAAMVYLDSSTDLYDTYSPTCGPQTDIGGYLDSSPEVNIAGTGVRGIALCTKPIGWWGNYDCDQGSVVAQSSLGTGDQFRKTMCHEIGHMIGLWHYSTSSPTSCMVSGPSTIWTYDYSERTDINAYY